MSGQETDKTPAGNGAQPETPNTALSDGLNENRPSESASAAAGAQNAPAPVVIRQSGGRGLAAGALVLALLAGGASGHLLHLQRRWRQRRPAWRGIQQSQRPAPVRAVIPARRPERRSLVYRHSSWLNLLLWLLLWPLALLSLLLIPVPLLDSSYFFAPEMRKLARNWLVIFGLMLLMVLPALAAGWRRRVWRRRHCGYDADGDYFYLTEGATTLARWPAANFIGIYWEGTGAGIYRVGAQLWLAGAQGRDDVALAELNYWYRSNEAAAARLAASSAATASRPSESAAFNTFSSCVFCRVKASQEYKSGLLAFSFSSTDKS